MGVRVAVAGASGYVGGELLRLVAGHPEFELVAATAHSRAGQPVAAVHPQLVPLGLTFEATDTATLAAADLVFLALPHGQSAELATRIPEHVRIVDLGADHRLRDPDAWARYYGGTHADPWTYGLPELPGQRAAIQAATRVANTGCYAATITLALAPLITAGLANPDDVVVTATSGTTGAGRVMKEHLLASEVIGELSTYKVGAHQHTPEIKQASGARTLSFTPGLAPMPRGILATVTARPTTGTTAARVRQTLIAAYATEPFVHVLAEGMWPRTGATSGSNACHLQAGTDLDSGRILVVSALDNLGKGAAGQAVQCANLMLGLDETAGLTSLGGDTVSVTAARGFRAAGVAAGLRTGQGPDVALVVNDGPDTTAAGVFTSNRVKAAPVIWSQQVLRAGIVRAVVLNAGGANACTGPLGFQDTHATAEHAAAALSNPRLLVGAADVAVCSTGLIGERLPMPALLKGVDAAVRALSKDGGADAARAIVTTDTRPKTGVVNGDGWTVGRHGEGRRHARPRSGHDAVRAHHRRDGRLEPIGGGAAGSDRPDVRPDRLRWVHVHQRHRAAAGQRRLGSVGEPGRPDGGGLPALPRPGHAAAGRCGGVHKGHSIEVRQARRPRRRSRSPGR